jgi:hypothetical protein
VPYLLGRLTKGPSSHEAERRAQVSDSLSGKPKISSPSHFINRRHKPLHCAAKIAQL